MMITLDQLSNYTAMDASFATVMKKSNVAGVDGITLIQFEINKHDKTREIGILSTKDRIVARTLC